MAWILMSRRTVGDYKPVFETIKELFPRFKPTAAHLDYEKGLRRALKESFQGIKIWSCHFHFAQVQKINNLNNCNLNNPKYLKQVFNYERILFVVAFFTKINHNVKILNF